MDHPPPEGTPGDVSHVVVTVVRTGGIGGMRRQWQAEPDPAETPHWVSLIDSCPWGDDGGDPAGADRFVWRIEAQQDDAPPREAQVPDSRLDGPWRTLVDAVRAARS